MKSRSARVVLTLSFSVLILLLLFLPVMARGAAPSAPSLSTAPLSPLAPGDLHVYNSTEVPVAIATNGVTYTSRITVTDIYNVGDVNVQINVSHTYDSDLRMYLLAPNGVRVLLASGVGGSSDNFINTIFDDEAATSISSGSAPFTGSYRPQGLLSALDGQSANGVWTLEIYDMFSGDTGTLNAWSITLQEPLPNLATSTKSVAPAGTRFTGDVVTYTVAVINSGTYTASAATLSDPIPSGAAYVPGSAALTGSGTLTATGSSINWSGGLAPNESVTVTFQVTLTAVNGSVTNTATISDPLIAAPVVKSVIIPIAVPVYSSSSKSVLPAGTVNTGQLLTYTVIVYNTGLMTGTATMVDAIPAGAAYVDGSATVQGGGTLITDTSTITWTGTVSASGRITVTFNARVTGINGSVVNNAVISDPLVASVIKSTTNAIASPIFSTSTKVVDRVAAQPNDAITYTIQIKNSGVLTASAASMVDSLPPGFTVNAIGVTASAGSIVVAGSVVTWTGVVSPSATIVVVIPGTINADACGTTVVNTAFFYDPLAIAYSTSAATVVYGPNIPFNESFDNTSVFPPTGWATAVVTTGATAPAWLSATVTVHPAGFAPFSGAGMARFNSYDSSAGSANRLSSPGIGLVSNTGPVLLFYTYHDTVYTSNDRIQVQVSTNGGTTWNDVGSPVTRYDGSTGWKAHAINLAAYAGQTINIGFLAISAFGNDIYLDHVSVRTCCELPAGASFVTNPLSPLVGQSVDFTGSVLTGTAPFTYAWDFADASPIGTGNPITHAFASANTFNVVMTVTNQCGFTSVTQPVVVSAAPTPPSLGPLQSSSPTALGNATFFTGTLLTGSAPITYTWDFGDGTVLEDGLNITHTFSPVGLYTVTLTAVNVAGTDVATSTVKVGLAPTASFTATNPTFYPDATTFAFTGDPGTGPTSYLWTIGTGLTSTVEFFTATLAAPAPINNYTSTLRVSNPYGFAVTSTVVTVLNTSADLSIAKSDSPDPVPGSRPLTYTLAVTNSGPNGLIGAPIASLAFTNTAVITINDNAAATPYPSAINVAGVTDPVGKVTVTLYNISHTFPDDMEVLLVGPAGQKMIVMANAGLGNDLNNVTLTFDDDAASTLPDSTQITSGTYKPTLYGTVSFPAPAPASPYATTLSTFAGVNPNGAWSLYVVDDATLDSGFILGGWSLSLTTAQAMTTTVVDTLPAGYAVGGASGAGWTCGNAAGTVMCTRPVMPIGRAPDIVITGNAPTLANSGLITNTASVSSVLPDFNPADNTATITTFVNALQSDLSIVKTGPTAPQPLNAAVTYNITVTNNGPDATTGVQFVDTLPAGMAFASASAGCANVSGVVTCNVGGLANGASASASIVVTATAYGTFTNTVTASSANPDLTPGNNTATQSTSVVWPTVGSAPGSFSTTQPANQLTTQTLTISNTGAVPLSWNLVELPPVSYAPAAPVNGLQLAAGPITFDRAHPKSAEESRPAEARDILPANPSAVMNGTIVEGFDDVSTLPGNGWAMINRSNPLGLTNWYQGVGTVFPAHSGVISTSYIAANYNNTTGAGTISDWLLTPQIQLRNSDVFTFYTRVPTASPYPDRLEVRMSLNGASTDVGTTELSVGDFTHLLVAVNPNLDVGGYPETWTAYVVTISGLSGPTNGRLAFRYFVTDGGPAGNNSSYIGIDTFSYVPTPLPCSVPGDIPWLSVNPTSGTTNAGGSSAVGLTFNSTGLTTGVYTGTLCLLSNDESTPFVPIPVSMTVKMYGIYLPIIRK